LLRRALEQCGVLDVRRHLVDPVGGWQCLGVFLSVHHEGHGDLPQVAHTRLLDRARFGLRPYRLGALYTLCAHPGHQRDQLGEGCRAVLLGPEGDLALKRHGGQVDAVYHAILDEEQLVPIDHGGGVDRLTTHTAHQCREEHQAWIDASFPGHGHEREQHGGVQVVLGHDP